MHALCIAACARADVRKSSAVSGWVRSEHVGKQRLAGRRHAKSPDGSSLCSGGAPSSRSSRQHATKSSITALPSNASSSTASSGTPVAALTLRAAPPPEAGPKGRTRQVPATPPASCARPPRRRKTSPRPWTGHGPDPSSRRRTCVAGLREQGHRRVDRAAGRAWLGLQGPRPHDSSRWRRTAAAKASGPTARGWSFARSAAATSATSEGGGVSPEGCGASSRPRPVPLPPAAGAAATFLLRWRSCTSPVLRDVRRTTVTVLLPCTRLMPCVHLSAPHR